MSDKTALGDRMKRYENVSRIKLTPRMPMIIRVDGKAFHTYTKAFKETCVEDPWSELLQLAMNSAACQLLKEIGGSKITYAQSDEISILVTDFDRLASQAWFDKNVQKVVSVAASLATAGFNSSLIKHGWLGPNNKLALFDARAFVLPKEEVANYFIWRQQDATRNSISMLAQHHFSSKQLHGKNTSEMQDMLKLEHDVNWNNLDTWKKRGWCVRRETVENTASTGDPVLRTQMVPDLQIPIFTQDRDYIEKLMVFEDQP